MRPALSLLRPLRLSLLAALLPVAAAQAAPPSADVFFKDADFSEAVLSPSGKQLALVSSRGLPRKGLAVIDLDTGKINRTAQFSDGEVINVRWVNEGRLIFSVSDTSEGLGRISAASGLFAVDPDGSNYITLVRRRWKEGTTAGPINIKILDWYHHLLRVPAWRPGETNEDVLVAEFSYAKDRDDERPLWVSTRTGRTKRVNFEIPDGVSGWEVDERGEPRVAYRYKAGQQSMLWRAPGETTWKELFKAGTFDAPFFSEAVTSDGTLYVQEKSGAGGTAVLKQFDFKTMAPRPDPIVVVPGFDFSGGLVRNPEGGKAMGVRLLADAETTVWFDERMKAFQAEVDKLFPTTINRIDCRRCGEPDMVALVRAFSDREPGRIFLYRAQPKAGEKPWRAVGAANEEIDASRMATVEFHRIKTRDGKEMPVWVTTPAGAKGPLPAVMLVHGGPWSRGGQWAWDPETQFLASRSYVVIEPEIRGSTGYGDDWFRAGFKQWGQAMQDDVTDALRWAQGQKKVSNKACIMGASYGGYSTLMGLIKDPALYQCGVAAFAVADLELHVKGNFWVDDDIGKDGRRYHYRETIGDADTDRDMLRANSPVLQAARIKAPLLLAFGERDRRVPLAHGERMRDALVAAGQKPEWVVYPGEGHGFGIPANRVDYYKRVETFLAKYLQP
jgi:dipeptidyl aminopeptidase/acylaminoacyl peptidase